MVRIPEVRVECRGADAGGELVVVVAGQGHHRQDLAGLGVHDDRDALLDARRAHPPGQGISRETLQPGVDGQHQVPAGNRLGRGGDDLDRTAGRVPLHLLRPVGAPQDRFVRCLHAILADRVIRQVAAGGERVHLILADRAGVAEDMGQQ